MKGKFTAYAVMVIILSSALNWGRMFSSSSNSTSSMPRGSSWLSNTGSIGTGSSGSGHK